MFTLPNYSKSAHCGALLALLWLLLVSWTHNDTDGPLPLAPDYADSTQWYIRHRGAAADLFYIISTETGDYLMNGDTCHFADTHRQLTRSLMLK